MMTNLPVGQIETILMHELYHLKRWDYLVNIIQLFIEGVLFYHPAVWIISGCIRNEREHCCDDGVLQETGNPVNYAKALIHIAEQQHAFRLAPGAAGTTKHHLKSRINRILNKNSMKTDKRDKLVSLALLGGSFILLLTISGFSAGPSFTRYNSLPQALVTIPVEQTVNITVADTIPQKGDATGAEAALEEIEEIDWAEIKVEIESSYMEALEEIEEIDWTEIKVEIESSYLEALEEIEEIDWTEIKVEIEQSMGVLDSIRFELGD
jgi:hypothetical protein